MKTFLLAVLTMMVMPSAMAAFKEGTHYEVINQTSTAKPEVVEFFSYGCGHCFKFEPAVHKLQEALPEDISFKKNHVGYNGEEYMRAFATAELLKVEPQITSVMFDNIHRQRVKITSRQQIKDLFLEQGVDGAKFDSAVDSFMVNGMIAQMEKNTNKYNIRGVPSLVVNGKYLINRGSIQSQQELNELVMYLAEK